MTNPNLILKSKETKQNINPFPKQNKNIPYQRRSKSKQNVTF